MDRLRIFQIIIYLIALAVVGRLFYWQFLSPLSKNQDDSSPETEIPAPHGEIYASDGFPLVTNQEAFLIYGKPQTQNLNFKEAAKALAPVLAVWVYVASVDIKTVASCNLRYGRRSGAAYSHEVDFAKMFNVGV